MSLNTISFGIFISIVLLVFFLIPGKRQWIYLLISSYIFYFISSAPLLALLVFSTTITFFAGKIIGHYNNQYIDAVEVHGGEWSREMKKEEKINFDKKKKLILNIALLIVLGILAFFKYFNFLLVNTNQFLNFFSINSNLQPLNLLLPLGISFYSFQSAGYIIDIYRGKIKPETNIAKFALFVSFFPQIIQGPISRYDNLANQLYESHPFDYDRAKYGLQLMLWGYFKKLVIADRAAVIVNTVFGDYKGYAGITIFLAALFYSVQIYCDFSGGIDIATGVAQVMGIKLSKNFDHPFFATSISDFWRRWHISLSSWMRDYIFYPLSISKSFTNFGKFARNKLGNNLGKLLPTSTAMFITFVTVGVWHGADWKFVAYGIYNGILISAGILLKPLYTKTLGKLNINENSFGWRIYQILLTIILVTFGRYFSRADSLWDALRMLKRTLTMYNPWILFDGTLFKLGLDDKNFILLLIAIFVLIFVDFLQEKGYLLRHFISHQPLIFRWALYYCAIFSIIIFGMYGIGYSSSSFIYMGF